MTTVSPRVLVLRQQIIAARHALNDHIVTNLVTYSPEEAGLLDEASGHLEEAKMALDRVLGESS